MREPVSVTGLAAASALGLTPGEYAAAMAAGRHGLRPLGELPEAPAAFATLPGGWLVPRSLCVSRRYGPASTLAIALAREAVADAGVRGTALAETWLFVGNTAGWLAPWPGRRTHRQMATSNSMHSEIGAAISIVLGIRGPFQVLSSGIADCLRLALRDLPDRRVTAICPHASGTFAHGHAECRALQAVFAEGSAPVSLHLMKPFTGHTIGASGALDTAILMHHLGLGLLPPNLPGLTGAGPRFTLPETPMPAGDGVVLKVSVGMGGHNAVLALSGKE
jgi:3-oxoacyl-(acyl-carrier-protein) synthase